MPRIDTTDKRQKWQWGCPAPQRHRDWRVVDGLIQCRSCEETYRELVNLATDEIVPREQIDVVGPHADSKLGMPGPDAPEGV